MSSDFKELNLDRTRLKECVEEFWKNNNCQGEYSEQSTRCHRVKYSQDGCEVMVDLLLLKNGTTTIHTKTGKHPEKGEQLAVYLRDELVGDDRKSVSVTIKDIDQDTFELLIEFLKDLKSEDSDVTEISISQSREDATQKCVKAISKYSDSLTLTHYRSTNKLLVQGKPLYSYYQVGYFLAEYTNLTGFIKIVSKGGGHPKTVDVDGDTIESELKALLPSAYSKLGDGILKMLRTSWTLKDIPIPLPDYSCYVFPSLRALEGVMRRLLFNQGYSIEYDNHNSFGRIFFKNPSGKFVVTNNFKDTIGHDDQLCHALEYCYNYFVQQRHTLFHANDFTDSSRFISTKEEASQMIEKIVEVINKAYNMVSDLDANE